MSGDLEFRGKDGTRFSLTPIIDGGMQYIRDIGAPEEVYVEVGGNLTVNGGLLQLCGSHASLSGKTRRITIRVAGDVVLQNGGSLVVARGEGTPTPDMPEIRLEIGGSLQIDSDGSGGQAYGFSSPLEFYQEGVDGSAPIGGHLLFFGDGGAEIKGATAVRPKLYTLEMDKGKDAYTKLSLKIPVDLALRDRWLTLRNGVFELKQAQADFVISDRRSFTFSSSAALVLDEPKLQAFVGASGEKDATFLLEGRLAVRQGELMVGSAAVSGYTNPDIEFPPSDGAKIEVGVEGDAEKQGRLVLYGSLRRNVHTLEGKLDFVQHGGLVEIYGRSGSWETNAAFEHQGGVFELLGGEIRLHASGGSSPFGDMHIYPGLAVAKGGTLRLMLPSKVGSRRISSLAALYNVELEGGDTNANEIFGTSLNIRNDLTLGENSILDAKGLDVQVGGDIELSASAIYRGGGNVTTLNGLAKEQHLRGAGTLELHRLVVRSQKGVVLQRTVDTEVGENLILERVAGGRMLQLGEKDLIVRGDLSNDAGFATQKAGVLVVDGRADYRNLIRGQGNYASLRVAGAQGAALENPIYMLGTLDLQGGHLNIGAHELSIGQDGKLQGSADHFVRTHGEQSDAGILKYLKPADSQFDFHLGVGDDYTPAHWSGSASGISYIRVRNVKGFLFREAEAAEQCLDFHWRVASSGSSASAGSFRFAVPDAYRAEMAVSASSAARYTIPWMAAGQCRAAESPRVVDR